MHAGGICSLEVTPPASQVSGGIFDQKNEHTPTNILSFTCFFQTCCRLSFPNNSQRSQNKNRLDHQSQPKETHEKRGILSKQLTTKPEQEENERKPKTTKGKPWKSGKHAKSIITSTQTKEGRKKPKASHRESCLQFNESKPKSIMRMTSP